MLTLTRPACALVEALQDRGILDLFVRNCSNPRRFFTGISSRHHFTHGGNAGAFNWSSKLSDANVSYVMDAVNSAKRTLIEESGYI